MEVNMAGPEAAALDVSDTRAKHDNSLASNAMGTSDLVFTVLAALAPLTLMVAVAPLHFLKGGSAVPGGFILAGCIMAMFAVGFMAMSRYVQNAGAFYSVIAKGLGKPTGSGAAMVALLAYNSLQISTYGAFGLYADQALGRYLGVAIPWWGYALAAWCCVAWLGFHGIHTSARVLACILVAEILILVVLAVAVGVSGGPEGFPKESFAPSNVLQLNKGAMYTLIFGAFMGFESTTIFSEEARGGHRTVRRATFIAVGFIAAFYSLMTAVVVTAYGASGIQQKAADDPVNLVVNLFVQYTPSAVADAMHLLLLGSAFAALLALHNVANRYFYALGREHLLPKMLATTHPKYKSPWFAGIVQSLLAVIFIGLTRVFGVDPYLGLLLWGSALGMLGIIFLWALCSAAIVVYMHRHNHAEGVWSTKAAPLVAFIALAATLTLALANFTLLTGATPRVNTLLVGVGVLAFAVGIGDALSMRRRHPTHYARLTEGGRENLA
jgi:amino acid transporter